MKRLFPYILPVLAGCCVAAPSVQAGDSDSCTIAITNCLTNHMMTENDEISAFVYDGDDAIRWADADSAYLTEDEVVKLTCNASNCYTWVEGYVGGKWREHHKGDSCVDLWIIPDGSNDFDISTSNSGC